MIKGMVIGFLLAIILLIAGVSGYVRSGRAPAAVADHSLPYERKLTHMALRARIGAQNVGNPPVPADQQNLLQAADTYREKCASCHGLPQQPSPYEKTMFPKPTPLFRGKGVTDDSVAESYWKVANGIRLSGMPSFKNQLSDTQMWQVSQLVANARTLPEAVKARLVPDSPATIPGVNAIPNARQRRFD